MQLVVRSTKLSDCKAYAASMLDPTKTEYLGKESPDIENPGRHVVFDKDNNVTGVVYNKDQNGHGYFHPSADLAGASFNGRYEAKENDDDYEMG